MLGRVGRALVLHELLERTRDRWVIVVSILFALLASAVSLYGNNAGDNAGTLTGPSLVTLASLLVPLVALVLSHDAIVGERERNTLGLLLSLPVGRSEVVLAKFLGRAVALIVAVVVGIGVASALAGGEQAGVIFSMIGPTILLGLSFLSVGLLISSIVDRPSTASSLVVAVWFLLVFFYDLGLLGLLVVTDGGISTDTVSSLVIANAAGLYRLEMMEQLAGPGVLENLGMSATLPTAWTSVFVWLAWIAGPVVLSAVLVTKRKVFR
jgi:Cu-processing system permease protein